MYRMDSDALDGTEAGAARSPEITVRKNNRSPIGLAVKRGIDILAALLFFALFGWLYLGIWIAVGLLQGYPAIYRHRRVGLNGKKFDCLKFRSMVRDSDSVLSQFLDSCPAARSEWERDFKLKNDPRVTPFGRFLRATSLDELPQFWNVLRGDMSLVGPRPIVKKELDTYYKAAAREYMQVKPGITGPWQVSGRHEMTYDERVALDCAYARGWTNLGDLKIVAKTVVVVVQGRGSY
jgi:exopolysaccharide production protein ExoY